MAQNAKAYVRKKTAKYRTDEALATASTKLLTEDEQLDQFVNLIIDIYLQNNSIYEELQHADQTGKPNPNSLLG